MAKYRKRPIAVEAWQWNGLPFKFEDTPGWLMAAVQRWPAEGSISYIKTDHRIGKYLTIRTLEGDMHAMSGDFVIRGIKGEFYPIKPDIFEATYEPVAAERERGEG